MPDELEQQLWQKIEIIEGETKMRYVTSVERLAIRKGMQQGMQQGKLEGKIEGAATILERQLTKRFGSLNDEIRDRINAATLEQLDLWADRILDAATVNAVFEGH
uniref:DUF4351 domain-containing protein n=1 Tax=Candidatus Kentrum sp. DK TaxID=2126562 RepID=A0A450TPF2_9GAMM|nr:MAG: protein of unknown function (DUF4351) [Candidatus Kentron sp. DK]